MNSRRSWVVILIPAALALAGGACASRPLGEQLWRDRCADCHGIHGRGNTPRYMGNPYADLSDNLWRGDGDAGSVEEIVRNGIFGEMPANPDLTREEMAALLDWLYGLRGELR